MLRSHIFKRVCQLYYTPEVDLFATRINAQVSTYVSWKPDPSATHINAFTLNWANKKVYAFPPFSMISRALKKLQEEEATVLMVLPLWPTQFWFPKALQLLVTDPVLLPRNSLVLPQNPTLTHPQAHRLVLTAMVLSGNHSKINAFRQMLPKFYLNHGEITLKDNMGHI